MKRRLQILICICMLLMLMPMNVFAAPSEDVCSLTVWHPLSEAEFCIYQVAEYSENEGFKIVEPFDKYVDEIKGLDRLKNRRSRIDSDTWRTLAFTLQTYVAAEKIPENFFRKTDKNGYWNLDGLERGMYLVVGDVVELEDEIYEASPVLSDFSEQDENGQKIDRIVINYEGKLSPLGFDRFSTIKIWEDDENEQYRPEEIEVELYGNNEYYDSVILNEENNWEHTWRGLPYGKMWIVKEKAVPESYKVSYTKEQGVTIIGNTFEDSEIPPPKEPGKLPQTGQLWWPVPILAMLGVVFYTIGWTKEME